MKKTIVSLALSIMLSGCGGSSSDDNSENPPLTIDKVNQLLINSGTTYGANNHQLECNAQDFEGCFIDEVCDRQSDYYSSKFIYGLEQDQLKAFSIAYDTPDCSGDGHIHPTVASLWNYTSSYDENSQEAHVSVTKVYYSDGFVFSDNKPRSNTIYNGIIWIDRSGTDARLCMSSGILDPNRPLFFMQTEDALIVDTSICATQIH